MIDDSQEKEEKAISVGNASYALGYKILAFALLVDVIYRNVALHQSSLDMLGIVILSGIVVTIYQVKHKIWTRTWIRTLIITFIVSAVIAAMLAVFNFLY